MSDDPIRMGIRSTGEVAKVEQFAPMPSKVPGRHRWIGIASHTLTDETARRAHEGATVKFGVQTLIGFSIGCLDCEEPYEDVFTQRCRGPEFDWNGSQ